MHAWQQRAIDVLRTLMGIPPTEGLLVFYSCLAVLGFLAIYNRLTKLLKFPATGLPRSILVTVLVGGVVLMGAWLALLHLGPIPFIKQSRLLVWIPYLGGLVPLFVIVAPLMRLIHRSHYGENISALLLSVAAMACMVSIAYALSLAVMSGDRDFNVTRERTATMNRFLNE